MKELAEFLLRFVQPLVAGGELHIGGAIDEARVRSWRAALLSPVAEADAIDEAREALAAELVVRPPRLTFGEDELKLAVALYNALVLAHPDADGWTARRGARRRVTEVAKLLAAVPPADDRRLLVARHTLLHNLFDLARTDTTVRWWTGKAAFRGQKPPSRLTAWPGVRNVRVDTESVPVQELFAFEEGLQIFTAVLAASPLTDLLAPERQVPSFTWGHAGVILRDAELARLVAHAWSSPGRVRIAPPAAAAAWERLLHQAVTPAELRATTAFLVHVGVLAALGDSGVEGELEQAVAGGERGDGERQGTGSATALFWALPDVVAAIAPELAGPPGLDGEPALAARWAAVRARARAALSDARVAQLGASFAARLGIAAA